MYVQLSSLILIGSIIIVHDLCSSFESMKNASDLTVMHNQCKPCGEGGARQGVGILPRSKYSGQFSKGAVYVQQKKKFPPRGKIPNKRQVHTFNNL